MHLYYYNNVYYYLNYFIIQVLEHPYIVHPLLKENKYPDPDNALRFIDYLEIYDPVAEWIRRNTSLITVDGNIGMYKTYNNTAYGQQYVPNPVPYVAFVRAINPKAIMVLLLRNPVTRMFSAYNHNVKMHRNKSSASAVDFHRQVSVAIRTWNQCIAELESPRACAYHAKFMYVASKNTLSDVLPFCMYYVFVEDILALIPRDQLIITKSEEYYSNRASILSQIYSVLDLPPMTESLARKVVAKSVANKQVGQLRMLRVTAMKIYNFFKPYNEILAKVLGSRKYLWEDTRFTTYERLRNKKISRE